MVELQVFTKKKNDVFGLYDFFKSLSIVCYRIVISDKSVEGSFEV